LKDLLHDLDLGKCYDDCSEQHVVLTSGQLHGVRAYLGYFDIVTTYECLEIYRYQNGNAWDPQEDSPTGISSMEPSTSTSINDNNTAALEGVYPV
jgi:hypothetical protein